MPERPARVGMPIPPAPEAETTTLPGRLPTALETGPRWAATWDWAAELQVWTVTSLANSLAVRSLGSREPRPLREDRARRRDSTPRLRDANATWRWSYPFILGTQVAKPSKPGSEVSCAIELSSKSNT